jgi:hypothetical protein
MEINYYSKYLKYKKKYIILKNDLENVYGGSQTKSLKKILILLKRGAQASPVVGNAVTLMNLVISASGYYNTLMKIINNYSGIKKLSVIRLKTDDGKGPEIIGGQVDNIWTNLNPKEQSSICDNIDKITNKIKKIMADSISVIPNFGPIMAYLIETTNIINFKNFKEIINNLDEEFQNIIYDPDNIRIIINNGIKTLNEKYNKIPQINKSSKKNKKKSKKSDDEDDNQNGSGLTNYIFRKAAGKVVGDASANINKGTKIFKKKIDTPEVEMAANVASAIGFDPVINKIINTVLTKSVHLTIKLFEILFPLFFTLLYIKDKQCKE